MASPCCHPSNAQTGLAGWGPRPTPPSSSGCSGTRLTRVRGALGGPRAVPLGDPAGAAVDKPRWDLSAEGAPPTSPSPSPGALAACQPCPVPSGLRRRTATFA